jgi:hypothetical protein
MTTTVLRELPTPKERSIVGSGFGARSRVSKKCASAVAISDVRRNPAKSIARKGSGASVIVPLARRRKREAQRVKVAIKPRYALVLFMSIIR